jgi:hypothetical protein
VNYNLIIVPYFLSIGAMDPLDILQVRFHFGGQFDYDGFAVNYVGGSVGMSFIERDKLCRRDMVGSLPRGIPKVVDYQQIGAQATN